MNKPISEIRVGDRHRRDMGDLQSLADSIAEQGLLQPIGITDDNDLVFGERRLRACRDVLGWTVIPARVVNVTSIVAGEYAENELRKDFTASERVAIAEAIERAAPERRGRPSDDEPEEKPDDGPEIQRGTETREAAARQAGFGSSRSYRDAKKVTEKAAPEMVEAMDKGEASISAAAELADEPEEVQREAATGGREAIRDAAKQARERKKQERAAQVAAGSMSFTEAGAHEAIDRLIGKLPSDEHERASALIERAIQTGNHPSIVHERVAEPLVERSAEDRLRAYVLAESGDKRDFEKAISVVTQVPPIPHPSIKLTEDAVVLLRRAARSLPESEAGAREEYRRICADLTELTHSLTEL